MKKQDAQDRSETNCGCLGEEVGTRQADRQDTIGEGLFRRLVGSAWKERPAAQEIQQDRDS